MGRASLVRAVQSALDQTWPYLQVQIVVASGLSIAESVVLPDEARVQIFQSSTPLSRSAAANQSLALASGRFALFLDDDDWLLPHHIERLVHALNFHPRAAAAHADVECLHHIGATLAHSRTFDEAVSPVDMQLRNCLPIHSTLFRTAVARQSPALQFNPGLDYFEDWDFWVQLLARGSFVHVPGVSAIYQISDSEGSGHEVTGQLRREQLTVFGELQLQRWSGSDVADLIEHHASNVHATELLRKELATTLAALDAQRAASDAFQCRLNESAQYIRTLLAESNQLRVQRDDAQGRLSATLAHYEALNTLHLQLVHSLSWRVTHPLRVVRALAQRGFVRTGVRFLLRRLPVSVTLRQRVKNWLSSQDLGSGVLRWLVPDGQVPASQASPSVSPAFDKEAVRAQAQAQLESFLGTKARIQLRRAVDVPQVSVIVVLYNQAGLTLQCLQALSDSTNVSFETIIVDNASSDAMPQLLERIDGATILRQSENLGFLRAVNLAADFAQGEHILLLNNDAMVEPTTLANAMARLATEPGVGAVGGPILLWDGRLQEAGSIVWQDGSCLGYGRGDSPDAPAYHFVRDVDYCSGAFLMVRRALFDQLGRFDDAFAPAYYEESDFCVRLWKAGQRIVYDPNVRIKHFEFASDVNSGQAMALQARNRERFVEKHSDFLATKLPSAPQHVLRASQVLPPHAKRVLIIDDRVPFPSLGRGYPRACMIANLIGESVGALTYFPLQIPEGDWSTVHTVLRAQTEVILNEGLPGLKRFLAERAASFDLIVISRPHNMEPFARIREQNPEWFAHATIVYDAEALFSLRTIERAKVMGSPLSENAAQALIDDELALAKTASRIVAVSQAEAQQYRRAGCSQVVVLGHALDLLQASRTQFAPRNGFLFVGAITQDDCPNGDSMLWFLDHVWPLIQQRLGAAIELDIVGVCESPMVRARQSATVRLLGRVDDLAPFFEARRVFVVPTRFAAGVPHKAHEAASRGLPMVVTPLIASQLGWDKELLVGPDAPSFAEACIKLHETQALWQEKREAGLAAVARDCSADAFARSVREMVR
jgi:GT2 family glycosyltransferase